MAVNLFYISNKPSGREKANTLAALSTPDLWRGRRNHAPHIYHRTDHSSCTLWGALHGHLNGHRRRSIRYKESSQGNDILCRLALHLWRNIIGVGSATWMKPFHVVRGWGLAGAFSGEKRGARVLLTFGPCPSFNKLFSQNFITTRIHLHVDDCRSWG